MRRILSSLCLCLVIGTATLSPVAFAASVEATRSLDTSALFDKLQLDGKLPMEVFNKAVDEFYRIDSKKQPYLTIIDYTKPSTDKRFFVFNMETEELMFHTRVAHGKNSGGNYATRFSNIVNSKQTSLGVFLTSETYFGGNGYSLRLDGMTPGVNDNARRRLIVIHGADYANDSFVNATGRLGRSWGCPALPRAFAKAVIDTIKDGSVIYAYG